MVWCALKKRKKKVVGWGGQSRHHVAYWRWNISSRKSWLISHWALVSIATTPRSSVRMAWSWSKKNKQPHHQCHWPHFQPCPQVRGDRCPLCIPETRTHFHPEQEGHNQLSPLRRRLHCLCPQKEFRSWSNMSRPLSCVYYFRFQISFCSLHILTFNTFGV